MLRKDKLPFVYLVSYGSKRSHKGKTVPLKKGKKLVDSTVRTRNKKTVWRAISIKRRAFQEKTA